LIQRDDQINRAAFTPVEPIAEPIVEPH
jgi:hypothetical protein